MGQQKVGLLLSCFPPTSNNGFLQLWSFPGPNGLAGIDMLAQTSLLMFFYNWTKSKHTESRSRWTGQALDVHPGDCGLCFQWNLLLHCWVILRFRQQNYSVRFRREGCPLTIVLSHHNSDRTVICIWFWKARRKWCPTNGNVFCYSVWRTCCFPPMSHVYIVKADLF